MREALWVGAGGFLGAVARYWLGAWAARRLGAAFPYGTLIINTSGSFILGVVMGLLEGHALSPVVRLSLAIGFVGAYTTFSTFSYETIRLAESGSVLLAWLNIVGSVIAGLCAALLGLAAGRGV
jgi:fluoride exporter